MAPVVNAVKDVYVPIFWQVMTKISRVYHCIALNDGQFGAISLGLENCMPLVFYDSTYRLM